MVAGDEARGGRARAVVQRSFRRCRAHGRVLRQTQIIVARERDQPSAITLDDRAVVTTGGLEAAAQALGVQGGQLLAGEGIEALHVVSRLPWLVRGHRQGAPSPQMKP
jgi:hypothetical protein